MVVSCGLLPLFPHTRSSLLAPLAIRSPGLYGEVGRGPTACPSLLSGLKLRPECSLSSLRDGGFCYRSLSGQGQGTQASAAGGPLHLVAAVPSTSFGGFSHSSNLMPLKLNSGSHPYSLLASGERASSLTVWLEGPLGFRPVHLRLS